MKPKKSLKDLNLLDRFLFAEAMEDPDNLRIFLNTRGKNPEEVSPELVELLNYIENSNEQTASACKSQRIHELQERVEAIKSSEEVSVKYMQEWEERELEKRDARDEGWQEGLQEGIRALIYDNLEEKKPREQIIEKLMRRFSLSEEEAAGYYSECMEMSEQEKAE